MDKFMGFFLPTPKVNNPLYVMYVKKQLTFLNIICPQQKIQINCFPSFKCAKKKK